MLVLRDLLVRECNIDANDDLIVELTRAIEVGSDDAFDSPEAWIDWRWGIAERVVIC